jgi:hypothetical protein
MSVLLLRNTTQQVQELLIREATTRRFHMIQVQALGQVDIDAYQSTPDVRRKVIKGIFKAFDEDGNKIEFTQVEDIAPIVEVTPKPTEDEQTPSEETAPEEFKCDVCEEVFASKRALSSHKRSHN